MSNKKFNWLKWINRIILQWLFIRLTRCEEKIVEEYKFHSVSLMSDMSLSARGEAKLTKRSWYSLKLFVIPLSGYLTVLPDMICFPKESIYLKVSKISKVKDE